MLGASKLEDLFDGVLENYSTIFVNVGVWLYYLDAESNSLQASLQAKRAGASKLNCLHAVS